MLIRVKKVTTKIEKIVYAFKAVVWIKEKIKKMKIILNKAQVVKALERKVIVNCPKAEIGTWAYKMFLERIKEPNNEFYNFLVDLGAKMYGPDYGYSNNELDDLLDSFIESHIYTTIKIYTELKTLIQQKKSIEYISSWALNLHTYYEIDKTTTDDALYTIMMMDSGPEFELSYEELDNIADRLIAGEDVQL